MLKNHRRTLKGDSRMACERISSANAARLLLPRTTEPGIRFRIPLSMNPTGALSGVGARSGTGGAEAVIFGRCQGVGRSEGSSAMDAGATADFVGQGRVFWAM
jgi:hypothetical protein